MPEPVNVPAPSWWDNLRAQRLKEWNAPPEPSWWNDLGGPGAEAARRLREWANQTEQLGISSGSKPLGWLGGLMAGVIGGHRPDALTQQGVAPGAGGAADLVEGLIGSPSGIATAASPIYLASAAKAGLTGLKEAGVDLRRVLVQGPRHFVGPNNTFVNGLVEPARFIDTLAAHKQWGDINKIIADLTEFHELHPNPTRQGLQRIVDPAMAYDRPHPWQSLQLGQIAPGQAGVVYQARVVDAMLKQLARQGIHPSQVIHPDRSVYEFSRRDLYRLNADEPGMIYADENPGEWLHGHYRSALRQVGATTIPGPPGVLDAATGQRLTMQQEADYLPRVWEGQRFQGMRPAGWQRTHGLEGIVNDLANYFSGKSPARPLGLSEEGAKAWEQWKPEPR